MTSVSPRKTGSSDTVNLSPVEALPGVHQIVLPTPWEGINAEIYLVETAPLTLIDTGVKWPPSRAALQDAFRHLGLRLTDVKRIIATHYHTDHMGQAQSIRDAGASLELYAHEIEAPWIENFSLKREQIVDRRLELFDEYGVPGDLLQRLSTAERWWRENGPRLAEETNVQRRVSDGERIVFDGLELQVFHAPGHTAGHIVLYEKNSGTLFTGDHIMGADVPFTDTYYMDESANPDDAESPRQRFRGLPRYLESLQRLQELNLKAILPAHGGVIRNPQRTIEAALRFYHSRIRKVESVLLALCQEQGPATAWDIWTRLFPYADPNRELRRRMLMVIGALDVLEEHGTCFTERRDDGRLAHRFIDVAPPF